MSVKNLHALLDLQIASIERVLYELDSFNGSDCRADVVHCIDQVVSVVNKLTTKMEKRKIEAIKRTKSINGKFVKRFDGKHSAGNSNIGWRILLTSTESRKTLKHIVTKLVGQCDHASLSQAFIIWKKFCGVDDDVNRDDNDMDANYSYSVKSADSQLPNQISANSFSEYPDNTDSVESNISYSPEIFNVADGEPILSGSGVDDLESYWLAGASPGPNITGMPHGDDYDQLGYSDIDDVIPEFCQDLTSGAVESSHSLLSSKWSALASSSNNTTSKSPRNSGKSNSLALPSQRDVVSRVQYTDSNNNNNNNNNYNSNTGINRFINSSSTSSNKIIDNSNSVVIVKDSGRGENKHPLHSSAGPGSNRDTAVTAAAATLSSSSSARSTQVTRAVIVSAGAAAVPVSQAGRAGAGGLRVLPSSRTAAPLPQPSHMKMLHTSQLDNLVEGFELSP